MGMKSCGTTKCDTPAKTMPAAMEAAPRPGAGAIQIQCSVATCAHPMPNSQPTEYAAPMWSRYSRMPWQVAAWGLGALLAAGCQPEAPAPPLPSSHRLPWAAIRWAEARARTASRPSQLVLSDAARRRSGRARDSRRCAAGFAVRSALDAALLREQDGASPATPILAYFPARPGRPESTRAACREQRELVSPCCPQARCSSTPMNRASGCPSSSSWIRTRGRGIGRR